MTHERMRAVVFHGPGELRVEEVDRPVLPAGGLVVRTAAAGICGSDLRAWRHGNPRLSMPRIPGHELAGVIEASDVPGLAVGTPVAVCPGAPCGTCRWCAQGATSLCATRGVLGSTVPGGMAEGFAVGPDWIRTGGVVPVPAGIPLELAAVAEPLHTVINGQDRAAVAAGDRVLVLGLGPIGVLHLAHATSLGATATGVDPVVPRVEAAAALVPGATSLPMTDGWSDAARAAAPDGFDVVVLATAAKASVAVAMELAAPLGRILAFAGLPADDPVVTLDLNRLHYRQLTLVGTFGGTPSTFRRAVDWLAAGTLDLAGFVTDRYPLDRAPEAFAALADGRGLKTILVPG